MKKTPKSKKIKKNRVVAVSGGFDPIHIGHVRLMQEARALGDRLVVILNNDHWFRVKGKHVFMTDEERKEIIEALECVDEVVITKHEPGTTDISVCRELREIMPNVFANGGDRFADNIPEFVLCRELGIEMAFNVGKGGKIRSSSELLKDYSKKIKHTL